jgi:hypothetical protein
MCTSCIYRNVQEGLFGAAHPYIFRDVMSVHLTGCVAGSLRAWWLRYAAPAEHQPRNIMALLALRRLSALSNAFTTLISAVVSLAR